MTAAPYQLLDPLSDEAYAALKASIAELGMVDPITVDDAGAVLDGHHRKRIAEELGIEPPTRVMTGLSEEQKLDTALALNLSGRVLGRSEKRETIRRYLLRRPEASDRHVGKVLGIDGKTVSAVRIEMSTQANAEFPHYGERVEESGRKARGRKPQQPDPEAVAARQAELARGRAAEEKRQAAKRAKEQAEDDQVREQVKARGGAVSTGRSAPRVVATQDRIKAAMSDCLLALTRALQDPGLDVDLVRAEQALPKDFRINEVRLRLRALVDDFGRRLAELEKAAKTSRTERDSADRQ